MGLNNWIMQRVMKREAKRIAKKVAKQYPVIKAQIPNYSETEILQKILSNDLNNLSGASEGLRNHIKKCCTSVEGLCYMIAMDMGAPIRSHEVSLLAIHAIYGCITVCQRLQTTIKRNERSRTQRTWGVE